MDGAHMLLNKSTISLGVFVFSIASTALSEDEYLRQVCDAIQSPDDKRACLRDIRKQTQQAAAADTQYLRRMAAEELNTRRDRLAKWKSNPDFPVYGNHCSFDFDCWLNLMKNLNYQPNGWGACKREIKSMAGERKWQGRRFSSILNSYLYDAKLHPMVVGYKGENLKLQQPDGKWERQVYVCHFDYAERKVVKIEMKPYTSTK